MTRPGTGAVRRVTAVVCAYTERRFDDLAASLASLEDQTRPPDDVVLVIDHAPALARRARAAFASSVAVVESTHRRGLSGARNTALDLLADAPGDRADHVVVFLDDDATARPDVVARLLTPYRDRRVAAVGGAAAPRWPGLGAGAPALLPAELWWVVGCSYPGQVQGPGPSEVRNLMGCVMSFRLAALDAAGAFTEDMGRVGTVPLGCEETELCIRLRRALPTTRIVLDPGAVVDHRVSTDRTRWSYLVRRSRAEGLSKAVLARRWGSADGLAAERTYTRRTLPAAVRRDLLAAARAVGRGEVSAARDGLAAAVAVPLALVLAVVGYVSGQVADRVRRVGRPRGAPSREAATSGAATSGAATSEAATSEAAGA